MTRFRIATINCLGDSHTRPGGNRFRKFADSALRTVWLVAVILRRRFTVVGLQEFQPPQRRVFMGRANAYAMHAINDNAVVWLRARWKLCATGWVTMPYFHGKPKRMPYVILRKRAVRKANRKRVAFLSVHNPASVHGDALEWRRDGWRKEARWARDMLDPGNGVAGVDAAVSVGDRNSGPKVFRPFIEDLGGHVAGIPEVWGIDWIVGWGPVTFDHFKATETDRIDRMTDHPVVQAVGWV